MTAGAPGAAEPVVIAPSRPGRRLVAAVVGLLAALLPAMVAGVGIDAPPGPGELRRLAVAIEDHDGASAGASSLVFALFVDGADYLAAEDDAGRDAALRRVLPVARLTGLGVLVLATALLGMAVALAVSRGMAFVVCACLALLPPLHEAGAVLRTETVSLAFANLGLLAMVALASRPGAGLRALPSSPVAQGALVAVAGTSLGVAMDTLPIYGVFFATPVLTLAAVVVGQFRTWMRAVRERAPHVVSPRAHTLELLRWITVPLSALFIGWLLFPAAPPGPTPTDVSLFAGVLGIVGALNGLFGAAVWIVGWNARPQGRGLPEFVLGSYALTLVLHRAVLEADLGHADALPAAMGLAVLMAVAVGVWISMPQFVRGLRRS